jgi:hypothetical protein
MKQSEKLDIILRGLYQHQGYWEIEKILDSNKISVSTEEIWRLAHRLHSDGYIEQPAVSAGKPLCRINSYGIGYFEGSSYTYEGQSLITNNYITVSSSPNAAVVTNSQHVNITITNYTEIKNKISELKEATKKETDITESKINEILDCLSEIEASVDADHTPKFSFRSLLSLTSDIVGLSPLVIALAKILGFPI